MQVTIPLSVYLMPSGIEELFSFRERIEARLAAFAAEQWSQIHVPPTASERTVHRLVRRLVMRLPPSVDFKRQHPIVAAWLRL